LVLPWTPRKRCAIAVGNLGVPTATSLRCHDVLDDCIALSRRLHGVPIAFFKGRPSHGVCNLQQNTNAALGLGDSKAFRGDATALPRRCWRSVMWSGDDPDRRENAALVWQEF
jgi:hypothetical protein